MKCINYAGQKPKVKHPRKTGLLLKRRGGWRPSKKIVGTSCLEREFEKLQYGSKKGGGVRKLMITHDLWESTRRRSQKIYNARSLRGRGMCGPSQKPIIEQCFSLLNAENVKNNQPSTVKKGFE